MKKILFIDVDATRTRRLSRRMRLRGYRCEAVTGFLFALTKLEWDKPDLIVSCTDTIDGMTPAEFISTLAQDPILRDIPAILVAQASERTTMSVAGFDAVLLEDDTDKLAAQLAELAANRQVATDAELPDARAPAQPGDSSCIESDGPDRLTGFIKQLDRLEIALASGRLVIRSAGQTRTIFVLIDHGQMVHAVYGALEGAPAFRRLVSDLQPETTFSFEPLQRWQISTFRRSIRRAERQRLLRVASEQGDFGTQEVDVSGEGSR